MTLQPSIHTNFSKDLMLECKDKEQAVFYLYRLYDLFPVDPRVLRPPAEEESLHTKGRKSNKRARAKAKAADEAAAAAEVREAEVKREAEEHGVPLDDAETVKEESDCGSGDEEVVDVCKSRVNVKAARGTKHVLNTSLDERKQTRQKRGLKRESATALSTTDKTLNGKVRNDSKRRRIVKTND